MYIRNQASNLNDHKKVRDFKSTPENDEADNNGDHRLENIQLCVR